MKARYIYLSMMAVALSFTLTACDDDDATTEPVYTPVPAPVQLGELTLSTDTLEVGVGETATFNIQAGGGDYKIINENSTIATATLDGTTVTVSSMEKGWSGIVVSDAAGNYKRVVIRSLYKNLVIDKQTVEIGIKLGHTDGREVITITGGNDGYTATVADENVARVSNINGNVITIQAVAEGTTTVTITDMMGVSAKVNVDVAVTLVPFTDSELADILAKTSNEFKWDDNTSFNWGTFAHTEDNGKQKVYWDYYGYYYVNIFFDGDLSEGEKTGGRVESKFSWGGSGDVFDDVKVEVLRNDGSRIWGVMSLVGKKNDADYLYTGYFTLGL